MNDKSFAENHGMFEQRRLVLRLMAGLLLVCALGMAPAAAQDLDNLRATGKVGERYDGYAHARDSSVAPFVKKVNEQRREIYQTRATEQGVAIEHVGRIYAKQIFEQSPAGTFFLSETNVWTQK